MARSHMEGTSMLSRNLNSHTDIEPIGYIDGQPIFPLRGAEGEQDGEGGDAGAGDDGTDGGNGEPDPLEVAQAETAKARGQAVAYRKELRSWQGAAKAAGIDTVDALVERLSGVQKDSEGKVVDVEAIRREAASAATEAMRTTLVAAQVKALAAEAFVDADDAVLHLRNSGDLAEYQVDEKSGSLLDPDEVTAALKALLKAKPHLAKAAQKPPPAGDFDGGARGNGNGVGAQGFSGMIRDLAQQRRGG